MSGLASGGASAVGGSGGGGGPAEAEAALRRRKEELRALEREVREGARSLKEAQVACRIRRRKHIAAQRQSRARRAVVRSAQRHLELCRSRGVCTEGAKKRLAVARQRLAKEAQAESEALRATRTARSERAAAEGAQRRAVGRREAAKAKVKLQALKLRQARSAARIRAARGRQLLALSARHEALRRKLAARQREAAQHLEQRLKEEFRGAKRKAVEQTGEEAERRRQRVARYATTLRTGDPLHADKFHRAGASEITAKVEEPDFSGRLSVLRPKGQKHEYTLVYLHQFCLQGTSYVDFKPHYFFSSTKLPYLSLKVTLPTAKAIPVTVHGGIKQYAWYDYKTDHEGRQEDELCASTLRATRDRIFKILDREVALLGGDSSRVFLGGASQGCCTALHCFLQYPRQLGGFVGVVGHLLSCSPLPERKRHLPIHLYNGMDDQVMRWSWVRQTYRRFRDAGYTNVRVKVEDGVTHEKPVRKERQWILDFLSKNIPKGFPAK